MRSNWGGGWYREESKGDEGKIYSSGEANGKFFNEHEGEDKVSIGIRFETTHVHRETAHAHLEISQ
jgi:hypothetical protein